MRYQFETLDNTTWIIDTENLKWYRVSGLVSTPSILAAQNKIAQFMMAEEGELCPLGEPAVMFGMVGRDARTGAPTEDVPAGPGWDAVMKQGLCIVSTIALGKGRRIGFYLGTNVRIKNFILPEPLEGLDCITMNPPEQSQPDAQPTTEVTASLDANPNDPTQVLAKPESGNIITEK